MCQLIVKLLLDHGAQVSQSNKDGTCALDYVSKKGHTEVVKILLEHGAIDLYMITMDGQPWLGLYFNNTLR